MFKYCFKTDDVGFLKLIAKENMNLSGDMPFYRVLSFKIHLILIYIKRVMVVIYHFKGL